MSPSMMSGSSVFSSLKSFPASSILPGPPDNRRMIIRRQVSFEDTRAAVINYDVRSADVRPWVKDIRVHCCPAATRYLVEFGIGKLANGVFFSFDLFFHCNFLSCESRNGLRFAGTNSCRRRNSRLCPTIGRSIRPVEVGALSDANVVKKAPSLLCCFMPVTWVRDHNCARLSCALIACGRCAKGTIPKQRRGLKAIVERSKFTKNRQCR